MVIFESTDRGATKVFDDAGLIMTFNRQNLNLKRNQSGEMVRIGESDVWIAVLEDEELIARAKKHPKFNVEYKIIDKVPVKNNETIVKTFSVDTKSVKRLGALEAQIVLKDGTYSKNATESEIAEYESLKKSLE